MKGTWQGSGTWQASSPDFSGLLQLAVLAGVAIGLAVIIAEYAAVIISLGVVAVAARLWILHRKVLAIREIAARGELIRAEQREHAAAALAAQRAHEIEVARAGAPVIQNIPDPAVAALLAAALGMRPQPTYQPAYQPAQVIRGEVER